MGKSAMAVLLGAVFLFGCAPTEQRQARQYERFLKASIGDRTQALERYAHLSDEVTSETHPSVH